MAEVDERGLEVTLLPARPLLDPVDRVAVRLFVGHGVEHADVEAEPLHADPEVRVLGHVERVPRPGGHERRAPEVVRRSTERQHAPRVDEAGEEAPEPGEVFEREELGERAPLGVVELEAGLETGHLRVAGHDDRGAAQLQRLGTVLRVVDGDDLAAAPEQSEVEGPGLGLRLARGDHQYLQRQRGTDAAGRRDRGVVTLLEQQLHLELVAGVLDRLEGADQALDDLGLVEGRHQHGVGRQGRVGERTGLVVANGVHRVTVERRPEHPDPMRQGREVDGGRRAGQHDRDPARRPHETEKDPDHDRAEQAQLGAARAFPRRHLRAGPLDPSKTRGGRGAGVVRRDLHELDRPGRRVRGGSRRDGDGLSGAGAGAVADDDAHRRNRSSSS